MRPLENRTELERLLADVWEYEDRGRRNASLPKWVFALTLTGAVLCNFSPLDIVAPVMTALAPASDKLTVDKVSSENVAEDLDYRIARHTESLAGWRAFLEAHADGPHAQAAQAEIDRLMTAPPPAVADQTPPSPAPPEPPPVMVEAEPPAPPQPVAEQSAPSPEATETPVNSGPSPVMVERQPAPTPRQVEVAEQSLPSLLATQTPVNAASPPVWSRWSRPSRSSPLRTRRCRRQDHATLQSQSQSSQGITVVCARSIARPVNQMYSLCWSRNSFNVIASAWTL